MNPKNECCCACNTNVTEMAKANVCPICHHEGISVGKVTVEHLVAENHRKEIVGDQYKICMNKDCDVVYYDLDNGVTFLKDQVSVPIWFKKDANPRYACYCSKVTEEQVMEAVVKHGAKTVREVNSITGAMKNPNCRENNPLGVCCHATIQEAIDRGLAMISCPQDLLWAGSKSRG